MGIKRSNRARQQRNCRRCKRTYQICNSPGSTKRYCSKVCRYQKTKRMVSKGPLYQADKIGKYTEELNSKEYKSEVEFKKLLVNEGIEGFKQNRQIGPYYADFTHFRLKIIVEVDGSFHDQPEQIEIDKKKTDFYQQLGFKVFRVRFPFNDRQLYKTIMEIKKIYKTNKSVANHAHKEKLVTIKIIKGDEYWKRKMQNDYNNLIRKEKNPEPPETNMSWSDFKRLEWKMKRLNRLITDTKSATHKPKD